MPDLSYWMMECDRLKQELAEASNQNTTLHDMLDKLEAKHLFLEQEKSSLRKVCERMVGIIERGLVMWSKSVRNEAKSALDEFKKVKHG